MVERLEGSFFGFEDMELFFQTWRDGLPRGSIVITHGLGEHSEYYHELASTLVKDHWQVFAWDLRGHGRSEGKRGFVSSFNNYSDDLKVFLDFLRTEHHPLGKPMVLFGHSMGGLVTANFMAENTTENINAMVLSSPAFGVALQIPAIKEKGANFLSEWFPKLTLYNEIDYSDLHRDTLLIKEYQNDPLRHDKVSPRLFTGMMDAMKNVRMKANQIRVPSLLQLAGKDRIVSTPASEEIFPKFGTPKKLMYIYPDSLHEIYHDGEKTEVMKDLKNFLNSNT